MQQPGNNNAEAKNMQRNKQYQGKNLSQAMQQPCKNYANTKQ